MFKTISEADAPHRAFTDRSEAQTAANAITNAPRQGMANVQFVGAWNCYTVEVRPRAKPYTNPAVLRENGQIAKYV